MVAPEDARPISLEEEGAVRRSTPLGDAVRQFRRNTLAVVGLGVIVLFLLMALSANLWTAVGLIDQKSGFASFHTLNPPGLERVDDYANPGTCARDGLQGTALWCGLLSEELQARYPNQCPPADYSPPEKQWCFVLGSDRLGKDWMTQVVYGSQVSIAVALIGASVSLVVGLLYGLVSGYYGGSVDNLMMRFVDFLYGMPDLVLIILMSVFFRQIQNEYQQEGGIIGAVVGLNASMGGLLFLFIAIGLLSWIGMARLTRGQVLAYREKEFVEAARAVGARDRRIILVHLLPNIIGPLLVVVTLAVPGFIFAEAFLSFIGLGVQPGTPSWGEMISRAQAEGGFTSNQHMWIVPSVALVAITLAFNFFGDGLRDALDPRLRGRL